MLFKSRQNPWPDFRNLCTSGKMTNVFKNTWCSERAAFPQLILFKLWGESLPITPTSILTIKVTHENLLCWGGGNCEYLNEETAG